MGNKNQNDCHLMFVLSYQSSLKFDLTSQPLSEIDTIENPDLGDQHPESLTIVSAVT